MECMAKGIPVYYEEFGQGKPLLMLHGWPGDHQHMVASFEPLFQSQAGWRRIYPDLPGMGKTPGADWITNQDHMLEAIIDFADSVIPEQPFAVAGVSYGGLLTQGLIYRKPKTILGAAFLVPVLDVKQGEEELPEQVVLVRDEALLSELDKNEADMLNAFATVHSRPLIDWLRVNFFPAAEAVDWEFLDRVGSFQFTFDANDLPEPFDKPVLFLMGRQDSLGGYAAAWKILPDFPRASYVVLDRAGHACILEQKALFQGLMQEWLSRVEETI